jgi:hypothetical protein
MILHDGLYAGTETCNRKRDRAEARTECATDYLPRMPYERVEYWRGDGKAGAATGCQCCNPTRVILPSGSSNVFHLREYFPIKCLHVGDSGDSRNTRKCPGDLAAKRGGWQWITNLAPTDLIPLPSHSPFNTQKGAL